MNKTIPHEWLLENVRHSKRLYTFDGSIEANYFNWYLNARKERKKCNFELSLMEKKEYNRFLNKLKAYKALKFKERRVCFELKESISSIISVINTNVVL